MRKFLKIAGVTIGILVIGVVSYVGYMLVTRFDMFASINPHFAGQCVKLPGVMGAEDIAIDHQAGVAYVSASNRRPPSSGILSSRSQDGIYRLKLTNDLDKNAKLEYLPLEGLKDFHPHGIDLRRLADGSLVLFVVNHNKLGDSVEILKVEDDHLVRLESVRHALIISPNDVASVGPKNFYVTNDRARKHPDNPTTAEQILEYFLPQSPTTVVYWDGQTAMRAASDIALANGIAANADGSEIYVAESLGKSLLVYTRDETGVLRLKQKIYLGSSLDNISVGPDGVLLIAGHPSLFPVLLNQNKLGSHTPSQVIAVSPHVSAPNNVSELYMNKGEEISLVTVAAPYGTNMFAMGTAYSDGVTICRKD